MLSLFAACEGALPPSRVPKNFHVVLTHFSFFSSFRTCWMGVTPEVTRAVSRGEAPRCARKGSDFTGLQRGDHVRDVSPAGEVLEVFFRNTHDGASHARLLFRLALYTLCITVSRAFSARS